MAKRPTQYWVIEGHDGTSLLFQHEINVGQITEKRLKELLRALAAKISLTEQEIICSYAKRGTKVHTNLLDVQFLEGKKFMYSCGTNPYVTAHVETARAL